MDLPCYEEKDDLLAAAASEGEDLSDFQLAEWRRRGLVPRPRPGRGRGRGKGRQYCYPSGTANLVQRIVRWLRWDRRLDVVAWSLWTDPNIGPETYRIPEAVVADAVDSIIGRYVDIDLWEREAHPDSQILPTTDFFRGLVKHLERHRFPQQVEASDLAFVLSTIARDELADGSEDDLGWRIVQETQEQVVEDKSGRRTTEVVEVFRLGDRAMYRIARANTGLQAFVDFVLEILEPLIPGWKTRYGPNTPLSGEPQEEGASPRQRDGERKYGPMRSTEILDTLIAFAGLMVAEREMFDPRFLGSWLRDPKRRPEVIEIQGDLMIMSRALFPERVGSEPPSPLLLWLLILVRRSGVTFRGARDAYWWVSQRDPDDSSNDPLTELDPLRRLLDAMPIKKTYLRGRPA